SASGPRIHQQRYACSKSTTITDHVYKEPRRSRRTHGGTLDHETQTFSARPSGPLRLPVNVTPLSMRLPNPHQAEALLPAGVDEGPQRSTLVGIVEGDGGFRSGALHTRGVAEHAAAAGRRHPG